MISGSIAAQALTTVPQSGEETTCLEQGTPAEHVFHQTLHKMITKETLSNCIAWLPNEIGFVIFNKTFFADRILPKYFGIAKYSSFARRLKRWGFQRVSKGEEIGAYYKQGFQKYMSFHYADHGEVGSEVLPPVNSGKGAFQTPPSSRVRNLPFKKRWSPSTRPHFLYQSPSYPCMKLEGGEVDGVGWISGDDPGHVSYSDPYARQSVNVANGDVASVTDTRHSINRESREDTDTMVMRLQPKKKKMRHINESEKDTLNHPNNSVSPPITPREASVLRYLCHMPRAVSDPRIDNSHEDIGANTATTRLSLREKIASSTIAQCLDLLLKPPNSSKFCGTPGMLLMPTPQNSAPEYHSCHKECTSFDGAVLPRNFSLQRDKYIPYTPAGGTTLTSTRPGCGRTLNVSGSKRRR